jgi:hypothetical protein
MKSTMDQNLFTQTGLDSGALTMLGVVVHGFSEAGEYRGTVRKDAGPEAVFYISVDKSSPVAQANVDLAALAGQQPSQSKCCDGTAAAENQFGVNTRGYAVFHVSGGPGGYNVYLRKADPDPNTPVFDSRRLHDGDIFSGVLIRPGAYSITNEVTNARGRVVVRYPKIGDTAYRPPGPVRVQCTYDAFEPDAIELDPGQGLIFECKATSRIKLDLIKPDDGHQHRRP